MLWPFNYIIIFIGTLGDVIDDRQLSLYV